MATNKKGKITNKKLLFTSGLGWMFDAMDVGLISFIIVPLSIEWQLTLGQAKFIPIVNSIGMAVGAFVFGILADRIGRKNVFIITILLFSVGSGLTALSNTLTLFLILRFLIGAGLGGELPVASTMVSESVPIRQRGLIVVLLESFWAVGWILSALIAFFIIPDYGWRIAMVICALPAFYTLYLRVHLPNSEITQKKKQRIPLGERLKLVWSKPYAKRTIMLWILWFAVVFSYYGMFLWLPSVMKLKGFEMINSFKYILIMALAQLPGYGLAAWLIERRGRKFVLVTFLLGTATSAFFFGAATGLTGLLISGAFLNFFNLGAWGALYAYTPEQYPENIRGTGVGMAAAVGRIGGIAGPLLIPILSENDISFTVIFTIFCVTISIGLLAVVFLGTETKNKVID